MNEYGYKLGYESATVARYLFDTSNNQELCAQILQDKRGMDSVQDDYAIGFRDGWMRREPKISIHSFHSR